MYLTRSGLVNLLRQQGATTCDHLAKPCQHWATTAAHSLLPCGRWGLRKLHQLTERNFQSLSQRSQYLEGHQIAGRFQPVDGWFGHVRQRLLAPAPSLTQPPQLLAKGLQNHLIFRFQLAAFSSAPPLPHDGSSGPIPCSTCAPANNAYAGIAPANIPGPALHPERIAGHIRPAKLDHVGQRDADSATRAVGRTGSRAGNGLPRRIQPRAFSVTPGHQPERTQLRVHWPRTPTGYWTKKVAD